MFIKKIILLFFIISSTLPVVSFAQVNISGQIDSVEMISDIATHNAFTDLIRYKDNWFIVFREADSHVGSEGKVRVLQSTDNGQTWNSAALLTYGTGNDLRDPHLSITPDNELMLNGFVIPSTGSVYSVVFFSSDGSNWDSGTKIPDSDGYIFWAPSWKGDTVYCAAYGNDSIHLFKSTDGLNYSLIRPQLLFGNSENETDIMFSRTGAMILLVRREDGDQAAMLGYSPDSDPYKIEWKNTGVRIGGPELIELPDGTILACGRSYDPSAQTTLWAIDPVDGTATEVLDLPSGGDTSYSGMLYFSDKLYISYYSSHIDSEAKIYFAELTMGGSTIYHEIFSSDGTIHPLSYADWNLHVGPDGHPAPSDQVSASVGADPLDGAINSYPQTADNINGYVYVSSGYDIYEPHLFWTEEHSLDLKDIGNAVISWYSKNTSSDENIRAAIRIEDEEGCQWYVTDPAVQHTPSDWSESAKIEFDIYQSQWRELNFAPSVVLSLGSAGDLPAEAEISAFGLLIEDKQSHCRFDNYRITSEFQSAPLTADAGQKQYSYYPMQGTYDPLAGTGTALVDSGPVGNNNLQGLGGIWQSSNAPAHTSGRDGSEASAFVFTDTNPDLLEINFDVPLNQGFEIEFYFKADSPPSPDSLYPYLCIGLNGSTFNVQAQRKPTPRLDGFKFTFGQLVTPYINSPGYVGYDDGQWHYVSFGYDAWFDRIWLQIDDQISFDYGLDTFISPDTLLIGATSSLNDRYGFNGIIDDLNISYYSGTEITSPHSGSQLYYDELNQIKWVSDLQKCKFDIKFSYDDGANWLSIFENELNDGQAVWDVPTVTSNECLLMLCDPDNNQIVYDQTGVFTVFDNCNVADVTGDCYVDLEDFSSLAQEWLDD